MGQNIQHQCGREKPETHEPPSEAQGKVALPFRRVVVLLVLQPTGNWRVARCPGSNMLRSAARVMDGTYKGDDSGCCGDESGQLQVVHPGSYTWTSSGA